MTWTDGFWSPPSESTQAYRRRLTAGTVPAPDAPWADIIPFALSFDGYAAFGGFASLADVASEAHDEWFRNGSLPADLVTLRSCLFFEQRRQRHLDQAPGSFPPEGEWFDYVRALVEAIRRAIECGGEKTGDGSDG